MLAFVDSYGLISWIYLFAVEQFLLPVLKCFAIGSQLLPITPMHHTAINVAFHSLTFNKN